ncbi:unnamed protein product, partial [Prorocentrum cordatum]
GLACGLPACPDWIGAFESKIRIAQWCRADWLVQIWDARLSGARAILARNGALAHPRKLPPRDRSAPKVSLAADPLNAQAARSSICIQGLGDDLYARKAQQAASFAVDTLAVFADPSGCKDTMALLDQATRKQRSIALAERELRAMAALEAAWKERCWAPLPLRGGVPSLPERRRQFQGLGACAPAPVPVAPASKSPLRVLRELEMGFLVNLVGYPRCNYDRDINLHCASLCSRHLERFDVTPASFSERFPR